MNWQRELNRFLEGQINMAKIMIIDDASSVRSLLQKTLATAGHTVIEAETGNEGCDKILKNKDIDLIITDYNMPGMDGLAMLAKVKETLGKQPFPVVVLTTETDERLKAASRDVGVIGWVNKPVTQETILSVVKKLVSMKKAA
ncbi:MAG: hypothetical protein C5B49_07840 [Bdellovibrio sp.]|nr:MAG: hypothetical protein C5B49_07840 [Bdellovibrio sp.]